MDQIAEKGWMVHVFHCRSRNIYGKVEDGNQGKDIPISEDCIGN
jgi:hypothetical protein